MHQPFTILYAHQVAENSVSYYPDSFILTDDFRKQLRWLKRRFEVITLSEAVKRKHQGDDLRNCVALTFDDGFRSCYDLIAPMLTDEKLSATFFINNNTIDNQQFMWRTALLYIQNKVPAPKVHHALLHMKASNKKIDLRKLSNLWQMSEKEERLQKIWNRCDLPPVKSVLNHLKPYMTSQQVQALHQANFEIGGHTFSHPFCNHLTIDELHKEITTSNNDLEKSLDISIRHFSYPFGNRPTEDFEKQLFKNTKLETVLGIDYNNHNGDNPLRWNRIKMENTLFKTKFMLNIHRFFGKK
ncbi:MAG: polysaccharide deacetylase family protein [Saprospiraceae bacterium]